MSALRSHEILARVKLGKDAGLEEAAQRVGAGAAMNAPPTDPADDPNPERTLQRDWHVDELPGGGVRVVFDGPYAAKHHEAQHFEHPRGGKPKFLEDELKAVVPDLPRIVAGEVRKRLRAR